ncbi:MAG TPA: DHH family phosphoesterase [Candidatus Saccharimonas sp.]|jgi:phosphoesterase RecJ-like protein|nr:DHH family phosphoesterase [Candidatus Saccharimonas sp.]
MYEKALEIITRATHVVVIQGENPDGDSLASSLALEELLAEQDKKVTLYCAITMPKYLRYIQGGDRVVNDFPYDADVAIIVDTAAEALVEKALATPGVRHFLESHPVVVLDHHGENDEDASMNDLSFTHEFVMSATAASTGEVIYELARVANWQVSAAAAEQLYISIASDTLGLTTQSTTATTYQIVADLVKAGAVPAEIELRRREFMKKPADILAYKARLIERIEYHLDGKLATVHIPWEDIAEYSDRYNPSVLVLDEMRLVEGVEVACAIKTYPDGKLTGKLRCNTPTASEIAGFFGGGGHSYAAGFKIHDDYETALRELLEATDKALKVHHGTTSV